MSNSRDHQEQLSAQDREQAKSSTRYNRHVNAALRLLSEHAKTACRVVNHQQFLRARQQVLCDLVLHQKLFADTLSPAQQKQRAPAPQQPLDPQLSEALAILHNWGHECSLCTSTQLQQQQQEEDIHPGAAGPEFDHPWGGCTAAAAVAASLNLQPRSRKHRFQQPQLQVQLTGPLPSSYVSRLLLSATRQQILQVKRMTAQCWQQAFAALMPQLLLLLEMASRHQPNVGDMGYKVEPHNPAGPADAFNTPLDMPWSATHPGAAAAAAGPGLHVPWATAGPGPYPNDLGSSPCWPRSSAGASAGSGTCLQQQQQLPDHPLGTCPVLDLCQLLYTVDTAMTLQLLALLHNPLPLLQALVCNYSPGQAVAAGMPHWQMVAQRLQLTEDQEVQLSVCHSEYKRMASSSRQLGATLPPDILAPSIHALLLEPGDSRTTTTASSKQQQPQKKARQPGKQQQLPHAGPTNGKRGRGSKARNNSAAGPGVLSGDGNQGCDINSLHKKLQKYLQLQQLHLVSLVSCVANTLSPVQLATSFVASYPFAPDFLAIAVAASDQLSSKQQQRLDLLQQSILQRDLSIGAEAPNPAPAGPSPAAGSSAGKKSAAAESAKAKAAAAAGAAQGNRARKRAGSDTSAASTAAAAAAAAAAVAAAGGGESDNGKQLSPPVILQEGPAEQEMLPMLQTVTRRHVLQRASDLLRHQDLCLCDLDELKQLLAPAAVSFEQQQQASLSYQPHLQQQMQQQQLFEQQMFEHQMFEQHQQMLHQQMLEQHLVEQPNIQQQQQQEQQQQLLQQQESHLWLQDVQQHEGFHHQQQQQDQAALLLHQVLSAAQAHWEQAAQQQQSEPMQLDVKVDVCERSDRSVHASPPDAGTASAHTKAAMKQRPVLDLSAPQPDNMLPVQQQQQLAESAAAVMMITQQELAQPAAAVSLTKQQHQEFGEQQQTPPLHSLDTSPPLQCFQQQQQQQQPMPTSGPPDVPLTQQSYATVCDALHPQFMPQLPGYACQAEQMLSATMQQHQEHELDMLQEPWCSVTISAPEADPFMELDFLQSPSEQQSMFAAAMTLTANLATCPMGGVQQE